MRLPRLIPVACGLIVLVAGCGGPSNGGSPTTSATASAGSTASSSASTIKDPLDVTKLQSDPCSALTSAQLAPYMGAVAKADARQTNNVPECVWSPVDVNNTAISVLIYPSGEGPTQLDQSSYPWHQPSADIAGYPAEHESAGGATGPQTGDCTALAAVSGQSAVGIFIDDVATTWQYYADACTPGDKLVAQVIANLKARG